ncbi:MAG: hypothetical protein ACR2RL_20370, partial [Gammaproteobacteria bacterium]
LLVSVELDEIMSLADRIIVMCEGRIVGEMPAASATERELGLLMANVAENENEPREANEVTAAGPQAATGAV